MEFYKTENSGVAGLPVILKSQHFRSLAMHTDIFTVSWSVKERGKDSKERNMSGSGDYLKHGGPATTTTRTPEERALTVGVRWGSNKVHALRGLFFRPVGVKATHTLG